MNIDCNIYVRYIQSFSTGCPPLHATFPVNLRKFNGQPNVLTEQFGLVII